MLKYVYMEGFAYNPNLNVDPREKDIQKVDELLDLARGIIADPNVIDPIEPVLLAELIPHLAGEPGSMNGGPLRPPLAYVFALHRDRVFPSGYALRKLEGGINKQLLKLFPGQYPEHGADPEFYKANNAIDMIEGEELLLDMLKPLRYNNPEAYAIFVALINQLGKQMDHRPVVVDVGVSFGTGTKKMKMYGKYPFKLPQAFQDLSNKPGLSPEADDQLQGLLATSLSELPQAGRVVGCDIMPMNADDMQLGFSETFLMNRFIDDQDGVLEFIDLNNDQTYEEHDVFLPKLNVDATRQESLVALAPYLPDGKADFFIYNGVILQFPQEELAEIFSAVRPLCRPGAKILVSEWAHANPAMPAGLEIIRGAHWHNKGGFKTFMLDPFDLDKPPIEICHYTNRQCEQAIFTPAGRRLLETGKID